MAESSFTARLHKGFVWRQGAGACGALAALVLLSAPSGAVAQAAGAAAGGDTLEEVTVTARRRSESISNVPISISALDATALAQQGVHAETDLQVAVPGLIIRTNAVSTQQNYSIRGQSIDSFTGSSPAVLAYTNDVEANTGGPSSFYDLKNVQVLKGPQGTLFGRNTTGGAVLFQTAEPDDHFGGFATIRGGNLRMIETTGAVNLPFSERVLLRLAGDYFDRGGYQRNVATGQDLGGVIRKSGRATLVLKPVDGLVNKTVAEYGISRGNPAINELYSAYPCGAPGLTSSGSCLYSPLVDGVFGAPGLWDAYLALHPGANPLGIPGALARQKQIGLWAVDSLQPNSLKQTNWLLSNTTTYDLTDSLQVKNIFGASRSFQNFVADQLGVPFGISVDNNIVSGGIGNKTTLKNYSDELQLLGKAFGGQLDYVAGLYWSSNRHDEYDDLTYFELAPALPGSPSTFIFVTTSKSKAAYAQGTYDLSQLTGISGLKFTGGARYTWETDGLQYPTDQYALLSGQPSESKQFSSPSWQAGFDYQITPQLLLYLTTRGSWRSGGFNGYSPSNPTLAQFGGNEFLPEKTHDVEFGAKFRGELAGMPTVLNIALYNQWITNIQRVTYTFTGGNASAFTGNIPAGKVTGAEFDAQISPATFLTFGLTGAYTNAAFTDGVAAAYGGGTNNFGPMGDVSRWSGSVYGQVRLPVPSNVGEMSLRAELYAQSSEYFSNLANTITPETRLPGYGLLNLRYDWKDVLGSSLTASAFSKNTMNKGYYTGGEAFGVDFGLNSAAPAEPRTYGVELNYRF